MIETFSDSLPDDVNRLATTLMREVCERRMLLALAESCTGGLLAAVLTDVEGCSHGFDRGFVVYTDAAKHQALGVPEVVLATDGAVSAPAAAAMAEGALARSDAHLALSVTGFAGAGGPGEEPGLVYFGLARRDGGTLAIERRFGDVGRAEVRVACLRTGMDIIHKVLGGVDAR